MVADNRIRSRRPSSRVVDAAPVPDDVLETGQATAAAYAAHITRSGLAESSIASYTSKTRLFGAWLDENPHHRPSETFTDPLSRDFATRDYRSYLLNDRGLAPASVDAVLAALDGMFLWLGLGLSTTKRVGSASDAGNFGEHLERDQDRAVMRAAERRGPRDLALVGLMRLNGLRISEVAGLDVDDYVITPRTCPMQVLGKGTKVRTVHLGARMREVLGAWEVERRGWRGAETRALFLAQTGARLSVRTIRYVVAEVGKDAGVPDLYPHQLRHTFAHTMLEGGALITEVQQELGHGSLAVTQRYTKPTAAERAAAVERAGIDW